MAASSGNLLGGSPAGIVNVQVGAGLILDGGTLSATATLGSLGISELTGDVTAGPGSGSQVATLAATAVTPGSYTYASLTVDAKGRLTAAASGAAPVSAANPTAQVSGSAVNGVAVTYMRSDAAPALAATAVVAGAYTYSSITVDAQGRLTAASSGAAPPSAANPTATVSGSAVNGAASTFMRSDAAPALADTAVTPGAYTLASITVDAQGRLTAASSGAAAIVPPQGRLTLTSGAPVMTADVTAAATIYYAAYVGGLVPVGATLAMLAIPAGQVSMGLAAANFVAGSVYDIFAINNAGAMVIAIGPAWTSTTARGTGAGTTELTLSNGGIWTNANSLTNAYGGAAGVTNYGVVAANAATYLGSAYATANGQTGIQFRPAAANGGGNTIVGLYNAYNRVPITSFSFDNTTSYTYNSATWRVANAGGTGSGLNNRVTWLDGLAQSRVVASFTQAVSANASVATKGQNGIVFDATSGTPPGVIGEGGMVSTSDSVPAVGSDQTIALGLHYAQAMEAAFTATTKYFGSITHLTVRLDMMS